MELQELEELLRELLQAIEIMVQSGEMTDELFAQAAQTLELLNNRIEQTQAQGAQPPPERLRMERPFPSSNVHSFAYDPKQQKLFVRFQDKFPAQNGPVYSYEGVPESIFRIFASGAVPPRTTGRNRWHAWYRGVTPSLGASMNALIKVGGYPYQRLS